MTGREVQADRVDGPMGHSASAHALIGWCAACQGRTLAAEVTAWRTQTQVDSTARTPHRRPSGTRTVCLDFDGVLHSYDRGWHDGTVYGGPVPGSRAAVHQFLAGFAVVVTTSRRNLGEVAAALRQWYDVAAVVAPRERTLTFWDTRGVILVTNTKMPAVAYVDDRGVRFDGSWPHTLEAFGALYGTLATEGPAPLRPATGPGGQVL